MYKETKGIFEVPDQQTINDSEKFLLKPYENSSKAFDLATHGTNTVKRPGGRAGIVLSRKPTSKEPTEDQSPRMLIS